MILIVSSDHIPHIGGKSTHIMDLMEGIRLNGEDVVLFSQRQYSKIFLKMIKLLLSPFLLYKRTYFQYLYSKVWRVLFRKRVLKLYKKYYPTCISCQDAFAAASLKKIRGMIKCPVVLTMHTYFGLENALDNKKNDLQKKLYDANLNYELESLEVVDKIIAVDNRIKQHVHDTIADVSKTKQLRPISCTSIENFTNIDAFSPGTEEEKQIVRKNLGIRADEFVIICARRLVEKNGVIYAVESMKYLQEGITLLIAGDGPERKAIEDKIKELGLEQRIQLLGSVSSDQLAKIYVGADCSLVPSITVNGLQEATSISALEAMSCGLPTVASRIGGLTQIIDDGVNGFLVDEKDSKKIAEAVIKLHDEDMRTSMSEHAREFIVQNHSHVVGAKKYLKQFIMV